MDRTKYGSMGEKYDFHQETIKVIIENQAKQMIAEMAGLKRWKSWKAGFGDLVCEDEVDNWYFQIPTNVSVYDPEDECLQKATATGMIDKQTGKIEILVLFWEDPWAPGNRKHKYSEEDVPKRYRKYPLWVPWLHQYLYKFNDLEETKKFLGWVK